MRRRLRQMLLLLTTAPPPARSEASRIADMDWGNPNHLLQALLVSLHAFMLVLGYRAGDKL